MDYNKNFRIPTEDYKKTEVKSETVNLCSNCAWLDEQYEAGKQAGRKEVVDWIKANRYCTYEEAICISPIVWQDYLKKLGL